jgi:DNA-binding Xre family transcriptional regulator
LYARWLYLKRECVHRAFSFDPPSGPRLSVICAAAAAVGRFPLLAVLVYVADEHPALKTRPGTFKASVVGLYSVVVIVSRLVRVGCARLSRVHSLHPFCGPGSGVRHHLRGHFRCDTHMLTQMHTNVYKYGRIFPVNYRAMEVNLEKLQQMRIDQGLSQRRLSLKAGLSAGAVAVVEQRGRARPDTLKKIADVLGVRASELVRE